ncbi:MAG: cytochrome P450 [Archangium sp.]
MKKSPLPPGYHGHWLLHIREHVKDPLGMFIRAHQRYGDIVFLNVAMGPTYLLAHPDHAQRVLADNARNFPALGKSSTGLMGNGLFASEGEFWRRQRRMVQPAFHRSRLIKMVQGMVTGTQALAEHWEQAARTGEPVELMEQTHQLVLTLLGTSLFSPDVYEGQSALRACAAFLSHHSHEAPVDSLWWLLLRRLRIPHRRRQQQWRTSLAMMDKTLYDLISERRKNPGDRDDILSMLLEARDSQGEAMTDKEVRDELVTLFIGGHESTSVALAWIWYALMIHPEVERRVREELATVLGGRAPSGEEIQSLTYTRAVVEETLRLYSPAWRLRRRVVEDEQIDGWTIRAGSFVTLSPYLLHRHASVWEEPERFKPERFFPEQKERRHRYAWLPFGGGQRLCIGNGYTLTLLVTVIATLLQRFQARLVPGHPVVPMATGTYHPRFGIKVTLHPAPPVTQDSSSTLKALSS